MNTKRIGMFLTALFMITCASTVFAAPWKGGRGSGGWEWRKLSENVQSCHGRERKREVVSVDRITPMKGMGTGIHLQLKTDKETISIHLAQPGTLNASKLGLKKG